MTNHITTGN